MKNNFVNIGLYILGLALVGSMASNSYAGQTLYQLKEANGTTLLTNKQSRYSHLQVEKKTYYPDSNMHSYSNWGQSEASVLPSYNRNKNAFDGMIKQAASQHGNPGQRHTPEHRQGRAGHTMTKTLNIHRSELSQRAKA